MTTEELKGEIWNFQKGLIEENNKCYWQNIITSLSTIDHAIKQFTSESNPEIAIGYSKLVIMEIWTIHELFKALGISTERLNSTFSNIKKFRDSYAHIKERLQGIEKPFRQPERELKWEKNSIANGKLISIDGKSWKAQDVSRIFNIELNGEKGALSIFGIVDNYLICNSGEEVLEIEIDNKLLNNLIDIVRSHLTS